MKTGNEPKWVLTVTKYVAVTLYIVIYRIEGGTCGTVTSEFQIFTNKSAVAPVVINSQEVVSLIHCSSLCSANSLCMSFSLNCLEVLSIRQTCQLHSSSVSNALDLVPGDTCYVQKGPYLTTSPTTGTTTTTTTTTVTTAAPVTAATTTVIDMVYGARDMCPSGSTGKDFLVLTTEGVYVYDEVDDLTTAPCDGPVTFRSIFQGYGSIPAIEMTKGILIFQTSNIELYSDGKVYRWQIESGQLNSVLGSVTYSAHLGTDALDNQDFNWAAHRQGSSVERHFYLGGDHFILKSDQYGTRNFDRTEEEEDNNGFDMNPWSGIPTDTVAMTGYGNDPNKNYALINSTGYVYTYHLDHISSYNNPTKVLQQQDFLIF